MALQGPEPAKRWLQQYVVGPWKRAGAAAGSSGGGGGCMAAGYCCRSLLLHGAPGAGKTELVHATAAQMGANLLYVAGGENLLKAYQQEGHKLLRALFTVRMEGGGCCVDSVCDCVCVKAERWAWQIGWLDPQQLTARVSE